MSAILAAAAALAVGQLDPNIVQWRTYKAGVESSARDLSIQVIETPGDYDRYLNQFHPQGAGPGRDIRWGKEELVAIHLGRRGTGGYSVEVSSITKVKPNEVQVSWVELTPVRGLKPSREETSPWTIVRLNRPGARLTFTGRREQGRLPGGIKVIQFPGYDRGCACCAACVREQASQLPYRIYAQGDDSPVLLATSYTMSSQDDFAFYVRNFGTPGMGDGSKIDWNRERLVAIHGGRQMTGGYSIVPNRIEIVDPRRVDVDYFFVQPNGGSLRAASATGPYLVLRLPRVGSLVTTTKRIIQQGIPFPRGCDCGCADCRTCGPSGR